MWEEEEERASIGLGEWGLGGWVYRGVEWEEERARREIRGLGVEREWEEERARRGIRGLGV